MKLRPRIFIGLASVAGVLATTFLPVADEVHRLHFHSHFKHTADCPHHAHARMTGERGEGLEHPHCLLHHAGITFNYLPPGIQAGGDRLRSGTIHYDTTRRYTPPRFLRIRSRGPPLARPAST